MARMIFAFNGDFESRLALHWLVHERGREVIALSIDLGQEVYLAPMGEIALDLGAVSAQVIDRRDVFLGDFCMPVLQANAVYQESCFLGSALARYVIAQELVRIAHEEGCAREAGSPEAAEPHLQLAMLYKAQLELLSRTRVGTS